MGGGRFVSAFALGLALAQGPLDLTGQEFLKLYVAVVAAATVVGFLLRRGLAGPHGEEERRGRDLDVLRLAYLRGGAQAAVETALLALERQGLASASDQGFCRVDPVGGLAPTFPSPFVAAVHAKLALDEPRRAASLVRRVEEPPFVADLRERGLVVEPARGRAVRLFAALPMLLTIVFGLLKVQVGITRDRPVLFLVAFVGGACLLALGLAQPVRLTGRGRHALAAARRERGALRLAASRAHERLEPADLCLAQALFGVAFLSQSALGRAFGVPDPTHASTGSTCGSSGSSGAGGSSSCGGGGGGGCGGCGG